MKFFDLSLPKTAVEKDVKIHKIMFEDFKKAYNDFPRELAERLVELGFGKWAPCGVSGVITVPQQMIDPTQFFFIILPTHAVKAIHVNDLVEGLGPKINDVVAYGENLVKNMQFSHAPEDIYDADEYDASLEDDFPDDEPAPPAPKKENKKKDSKSADK